MENPWDTYIKEGNLEIIQYLHKNNIECPAEFIIVKDYEYGSAMDYAARNGHLEIVKYLHENKLAKCTEQAMDCASENGHLKVFKYIRGFVSILDE